VNCPKISYLLVTFLLLIGCVIAQEPQDWAKRDYAAPADQVFAAIWVLVPGRLSP
jgi:hypothetical protein